MEHLALEVFDLVGSGSQFANLPPNTTIRIRRTSQIFGSGSVFTQEFTLNVAANAHLFGTAGDIHGSRLHEQINKRKARIWAMGLPLYLGYLRLADEVEVDKDGNVDVTFESGQKTFEDMIEGTKAREVSVGDVVIGVALNRKRVVDMISPIGLAVLNGLEPYAANDERIKEAAHATYRFDCGVSPGITLTTPYVQQWPKMVKSQGTVFDSSWSPIARDYTNVQTPYDVSHTFCNINICYPFKSIDAAGEEKSGRGYTVRLAHGNITTDGGDNQTRYNNAPNFYLLHFIDRLFKDLKIHIEENQAMDVEDLRRVFMLNYGCHYEELEGTDLTSPLHSTPSNRLERYGQYYLPIVDKDSDNYLLESWDKACMQIQADSDTIGKVLLRDVEVFVNNVSVLKVGSIEGKVADVRSQISALNTPNLSLSLKTDSEEESKKAYSAYLAYATGDNYPNVDIREIIEAMKAMFGVRLLFSDDYKRVRIVLLRNVFRSNATQTVNCEIVDEDVKVENCIRGFRMTYGKGTEDTNYYYKGFNDLFPRASKTWKDTTDKHDYSQWDTLSPYGTIKQYVSAANNTCYVTPETGNAYTVKVDEDENVLFPSLFEVASFMDAEDGDCSGESDTIAEVAINASPIVMNEIGNTYALLYNGDMKAPTPDNNFEHAPKIATFGRVLSESVNSSLVGLEKQWLRVEGKLDVYISEGFQIRMKDNYSISNGGTPFDDVDPGLCFGIMRGSGADSRVAYYEDTEENEDPKNDYWEIVPGSGAIDHSDTCDSYGNEWDYNGTGEGIGTRDGRFSLKLRAEKLNPYYSLSQADAQVTPPTPSEPKTITTKEEAAAAMTSIFTWSNSDLLNRPKVSGATMRAAGWSGFSGDYATVYSIQRGVQLAGGEIVEILWTPIRPDGTVLTPSELDAYIAKFGGDDENVWVAWGVDWLWDKLILDVYTTEERAELLHNLQAIYYDDYPSGSVVIDDESTETSGTPVTDTSGQYLPITNPNLRGRGLCDQFYKEYSYWVRNARIVKRTVRMELAQLLSIDDTVRVTVGDVTGFINEMEYDIDMQTGLGNVTMEIMYI